jgi:hypothetical protein
MFSSLDDVWSLDFMSSVIVQTIDRNYSLTTAAENLLHDLGPFPTFCPVLGSSLGLIHVPLDPSHLGSLDPYWRLGLTAALKPMMVSAS